MGNDPSHYKGKKRPVEKVSYDNVQTFLKKLCKKEGRKYRLPTEAEWEYACRAGTTTKYFFGEDPNDLDDYVWHSGNTKTGPKGDTETQDVGKKKPNSFGLCDMLGNVCEYCSDWFD